MIFQSEYLGISYIESKWLRPLGVNLQEYARLRTPEESVVSWS